MVATTECAPKAEVAKGVSAGQPFIVSKTEVRTIPNGVIAQTEHIVDQEERPVNQYN
jgi:hypothetical protein